MKQIRYGLFETNSSSVHSITLLTKKDYEDWISHKIAIKLTSDFDEETWRRNNEIPGLEEWGNNSVECYNYEKVDMENRITATKELLKKQLDKEEYSGVDLEQEIINIEETGKISDEVLDDYELCFLTPEEFKKAMTKYDCGFLFSGYSNELVLIGKYYHT